MIHHEISYLQSITHNFAGLRLGLLLLLRERLLLALRLELALALLARVDDRHVAALDRRRARLRLRPPRFDRRAQRRAGVGVVAVQVRRRATRTTRTTRTNSKGRFIYI